MTVPTDWFRSPPLRLAGVSSLLCFVTLDAQEPTSGQLGRIGHARPGPWGNLEYTRIVIEPPDEFLAADYPPPYATIWRFPGYTPERLQTVWASAGLGWKQLHALEVPGAITVSPDGIEVRPPAELAERLSADERGAIYRILAGLPGNPYHQMPFRFRADLVDEWLDGADLPAPVIARIQELLYYRGNSALFSDLDLVLPLLRTAPERVRLIKTLARKSTLLLRLRVTPGSDVNALADYWGAGPRRKDVKPLLQSLTRHREGITLDVAHLLPRFARGLLYTYPPRTEPLDPTLDCHWTSMNFFRDEPDPRFADIEFLREAIKRDYAPVPDGKRQLGDLLILTRPDGQIVHSCIHIADDIVFTKNGYSFQMPWVLNTLPDLRAAYPSDPPLLIHAFRRKR